MSLDPRRSHADRAAAPGASRRVRSLESALTPTMGALHEGHLSLVRPRPHATPTSLSPACSSIRPSSGPSEDFYAYPRDEARDLALLAERRLRSALCARRQARSIRRALTPTSRSQTVAAPWKAPRRPHHFAGVATVVAKLLIQAAPDFAVFGEKDYQQLQVIRRMAVTSTCR